MNPMCLFLGHRRSRKDATFNNELDRWESRCKRCGIRMVRVGHHEWELSESDEA